MLKFTQSIFIVTLLYLPSLLFSKSIEDYLVPAPQEIKYNLKGTSKINTSITHNDLEEAIRGLLNINAEGSFILYRSSGDLRFVLSINSKELKPQGYYLRILRGRIEITGQNQAALYYAKLTLLQLLEYSKKEQRPLPSLTINDWPDFQRRGYMLDISRDKVPTMETLYEIIDNLSKWKINEFQLYTEHTFAYKNHKIVWENASPITPSEIKQLQEYCKQRFIDLVPNQNSFGHMENWLKHDEYLHLAECPEDCKTVWGDRKRHSLNPTNPKSLELMQELYAELLPNFESRYFNIGCDETIELGNGLSADACNEFGKGEVYLDFVIKLNNEVNKYEKQTMFWGDIILNHPKLIPEIPKNMIALVWGYDSDFPFKKNLPLFKKAGLDFYVCPGTSTWRSLIGRNEDAFLNLKNAAINGKENGAKGYLNTDWGDHGHWQPLSVSYPTMMLGAAYAWKYDENTENNIEYLLNNYVFNDSTENSAKALLMLGNAYKKTKIPEGNANAFHLMLHRYKWTMNGQYQTKKLSKKGLIDAHKEIETALEILKSANPNIKDSTILNDELMLASQLSIHAINLGLARLDAPNKATENIPNEVKMNLYSDLKPLIERHRKLWIVRNRPGGLDDSANKLEEILKYYKE
jgi:hexosaminidase